MNEALCTWCQDIFQGKVNWDPDGDPEWTLKQVQLHHKCLEDLKRCGEGECILCAALWLEFPKQVRAEWLASDEKAEQESRLATGQCSTDSQLFYRLILTGCGESSIHIELRSHTAPDLRERAYTVSFYLHRAYIFHV